jgi:PAS domain S-box-containing protein
VGRAERIAAAVDAMAPGFALYSPDEHLVTCNRAYTEQVWPDLKGLVRPGQTISEIIDTILTRRHADMTQEWREAYRAAAMRRHRVLPSTVDIPLKDGRWIRQRKYGLADGSVVASFIDVTELKEQESAAQAAAERHRNLLEKIPDAILIHTEARIVYANAAALKLYGAAAEADLIGRPIVDIVRSDIRHEVQSRLETPGDEPDRVTAFDAKGVRLDGGSFDIEVHAAPVVWNSRKSVVVVVRDLTEWTRAAAALTAVADQNRRLLETFPDGIVVHRNGINIFANPAAVKLRGAERLDQVIGHDIREIVPESMHATIFGRIREGMASGRELPPIEVKANRLDGKDLYVEARSAPLQWYGETSILTVLRDLTERRQAEAATAEIAEQNRRLLETLPDGVIISRDGAVAYVNPAAIEMLRASDQDQIVGSPWLQFVTPAYRDLIAACTREMVKERKSLPPIDYQLLRFDGRLVDIEARPAYIEWKGGPAILVVLRDLTERRRTEEKLRETERRYEAIAANIPGAVFQRVLDPNGRFSFTYVSDGVFRTHGITTAEALGDKSRLFETLHPDDREAAIEGMQTSARNLTPHDIELRNVRPDGRLIWVRSISRPHRRSDGAIVWDGIFIDITERKHVEIALRDAKDAAELANRSKSQFLATVSHELRTPLNAIIGFSDILKQEMFGPLGNPPYRAYAEDIYDSGRHLLQLINDILDLAKIEAGKFDLHLTAVDVGNVVLSSLRMVRGRADDKGIALQIETDA